MAAAQEKQVQKGKAVRATKRGKKADTPSTYDSDDEEYDPATQRSKKKTTSKTVHLKTLKGQPARQRNKLSQLIVDNIWYVVAGNVNYIKPRDIKNVIDENTPYYEIIDRQYGLRTMLPKDRLKGMPVPSPMTKSNMTKVNNDVDKSKKNEWIDKAVKNLKNPQFAATYNAVLIEWETGGPAPSDEGFADPGDEEAVEEDVAADATAAQAEIEELKQRLATANADLRKEQDKKADADSLKRTFEEFKLDQPEAWSDFVTKKKRQRSDAEQKLRDDKARIEDLRKQLEVEEAAYRRAQSSIKEDIDQVNYLNLDGADEIMFSQTIL
jgi:hypothetical protein